MRVDPGVRCMLGSAFAFSLMSLFVKQAGRTLPTQEIVLARAVVTLVLSWAWLARLGLSPWGDQRGLLALRGLLGFGGLSCFYYAVTHLPIAEATVIQYLHPVFTAVLAGVLLGERVGVRVVVASAVSLLGVGLVTRPAFLFGGAAAGLDPFAAGVALAGAVFSAGAYVAVRRLAAREHPLVIVFWFPLVAIPLAVPATVPVAVWPSAVEWALLLAVGVTTQAGQVLITRGLALVPAARATAIAYLQVVFAALWGVLFFAEALSAPTVAGALLVLAGTLLASQRARPAAPTPPGDGLASRCPSS